MDYLFAPDQYVTPDFLIRSYRRGDGAMLSEAATTSYDHLHTYMPWAIPDYKVGDAERWCRIKAGHYLTNEDFSLGIFTRDGTKMLGGTGYHLREGDISTHNAEVGMWIRADAAKKGLGTQVLIAVIDWGFTQWPWMRLSWRCDTTNVASARVAEKAGMTREGLLRSDFPTEDNKRRDTYIYSIIKSEWLARQPKKKEW